MACAYTSLSSANCRAGNNPGVLEAYVIGYDDIATTTWTAGVLTAYTLVADKEWARLTPLPQSSFLNQTKNATTSSVSWDIVLTMLFGNNDAPSRKILKDIDDCCNLIFVVVDAAGKRHFCGGVEDSSYTNGIRPYNGMTGAGSRNTGTSGTDQAVHTFTLQSLNQSEQAPYMTAAITPIA